jgi:hypothetical protein
LCRTSIREFNQVHAEQQASPASTSTTASTSSVSGRAVPLAPKILNSCQSLSPEVLNIISISLTPAFMEYLEKVDSDLVSCEGAGQSGDEGARQSGATRLKATLFFITRMSILL